MTELTELNVAVLDALEDALLLVNRDLRVVSCNQSCRRWLARLGHASSPVGESVLDVVPFLSPTTMEEYRAVFGAGRPVVSEENARLGDASVSVEIRKLPVRVAGQVGAVAILIQDVSHRRQLEETLRLKDAAIELSASGIALCDLKGVVTYANRSFAAMWGCSDAGVLIGTQFGALWQAREAAEDALMSLPKRGAWSGELMARRHDGSFFGAHLSASLVRQENGSPSCSIVAVSDVSERVGPEEALDESGDPLRTLLDVTPDAVFLADSEGHVLTANRAAADAFERPLEQVLGRRISELLTHDEAELVESHKDVAVRSGQAVHFKARAGGRVHHYRLVPVSEGPIAVKKIAVFRQDVTERASDETALQEANRALQALIEAAPSAIVRLSREGVVKLWNRTAEQWFGWTEAEAVGHLFPALPEQGERAFRMILDQVSRGGTIQTAEVVYRRRSGKPIELMLSMAPVLGSDGKVSDLVMVAADTTERNRRHALLVEAQEMEALSRLSHGVSHDFNNLLQAIMSSVEVLRSCHESPERIAAVAHTLQERAQQGAALTRQLTLISHRGEPHVEVFDLSKVVAEEVEVLRTMLPANVAIGQENERAGLTVEGDAEQLKQVVVNLATNAAAAMPDGGSLELRTGRRGKGWVWLEVSDTGVGIPAELQEKVFEPFFTTKDPGTSTGLGLTVVKEIVSRHRGRVTLESREGVGTTFKIELPGAAAGAKPAERPVAGKVPTAPGHGQGERVLLVEDEVAAREGLTEMLKMLDYRVTSVESGEMAGLLPSEPAFDLLLADVMLPGATGTELARGLKERWPALRVLLMSGYTKDEADRLTAPPTGTRFLQKPFDMATLAHEVRAALDEGKP
jgi:hypothetical protein